MGNFLTSGCIKRTTACLFIEWERVLVLFNPDVFGRKTFYWGHLEQVLLYFFQNVVSQVVNQYDMFISFCSLGLCARHHFDMLIMFWSLKSSGIWYLSVADVLCKCHSALIFRIQQSAEGHDIPEDMNLQQHQYENFQSCMIILLL